MRFKELILANAIKMIICENTKEILVFKYL